MELYIGGYGQGKLGYVLSRQNESKGDAGTRNLHLGNIQEGERIASIDIIECGTEDFEKQLYKRQFSENSSRRFIVNRLHLWVKKLIKDGKNPEKVITDYAQANPECIFICDEIGNGIIPLEKSDRIWREETGRVLISIAKKAERVERILCGLGMRIV